MLMRSSDATLINPAVGVTMEIDQERIQSLIDSPSETLSVEIKNWIRPDEPHGQAKIVRAALALRNQDGGYLVIGFDDKSLTQDRANIPQNVRATYHSDTIQGLVGRFASEPFEISVAFGRRGDLEHPVIVVPSGVKTPVASKSSLEIDGKPAVSQNDVYVRTLNSSNVPATSKANWKDWRALVDRCYDNRDADIGRFIRRHLTGGGLSALRDYLEGVGAVSSPTAPAEQVAGLLDLAATRMDQIASDREIVVPKVGWWSAAFVIEGQVPSQSKGKEFLRRLDSSNPRLTGWPMWLVSDRFSDSSSHPFKADGVWEALVDAMGIVRHFQYMRYDPVGQFAQRSALVDDTAEGGPTPNTVLDFAFAVQDCAEAIAVGLVFAKAMECAVDSTTLHFAFRWSGLAGRELSSWAHRNRYISPGRKAHQDEVTINVAVPLDTPSQSIGALLHMPLQELYEVFDDFQLSLEVVYDIASRVLSRSVVI